MFGIIIGLSTYFAVRRQKRIYYMMIPRASSRYFEEIKMHRLGRFITTQV